MTRIISCFSYLLGTVAALTFCVLLVVNHENPSCSSPPVVSNPVQRIQIYSERNPFHELNDEDIYIYSAFLDLRFTKAWIRVLGMQRQNTTSVFYCEFSHDGDKINIPPGKISAIFPSWPSDKLQFHAYYYEFAVPDMLIESIRESRTFRLFVPGGKSYITLPITPTGIPNADNGHLAVCVKVEWGRIDARRLVEWVEFNRALGVQKVVFYDTVVQGAANRVIKYYENLGFVEVIHFNYLLHMSSLLLKDPIREKLADEAMLLEQAYLVAINDCVYRLADQFDYIQVIDLDEIITPTKERSLIPMIKRAAEEYPKASAFGFATAWHFDAFGPASNHSVLRQLHTQTYLKRTPILRSQPKTIFKRDGFVTVNWHGTVSIPVEKGYLGNLVLSWEHYGYVHHYRRTCMYEAEKCKTMLQNAEIDDVIPRYLDELNEAVQMHLDKIVL